MSAMDDAPPLLDSVRVLLEQIVQECQNEMALGGGLSISYESFEQAKALIEELKK